ncbi:hypothetical protein FB451DRAFT_1453390, partial [Mycena latifolia]
MSGATVPRISAVIGRPKGSKNKPDHRAGGLRQGSGPKKKNPSEPSGSGNAQEAPERQPPATVWTRASISRGNGNPNLYDMFKPKLGQNTSSTTENLDTPMSESGVPNNSAATPFPFLPPEHVDTDLNDDSEAGSDFEDLLEESIPSEPLPNEATVDTSGAISIYLAGIKARLGSFWIHPPAPFFALQEKDLKPTGLYYPSVFIWFPHLFKLGTTLTCPNQGCAHFQSTHRPLEIKGFNDKPLARRVIGLDRVYYVLTMRIQCKKKNQTGCGGSWNLYDPLILEQLDRGLADCFPAFLTARSGIDKTLMTLIRAGIAHRLSASAWSKILRELHVREHDLLPKYLMKLNGVMTFVALFTILNEFEQIRFQAFVPTKSLSHIHAALEGIVESLKAHGLPQPVLGFTDNVASDAATFMKYIPSLAESV